MGDDELLRRLGALEREYDADFPHEWEAVVKGELDPAEAAAAREGVDSPEEAALFAEMFRPLGDAEADALAGRLASALAEGRAPAPAAADAVPSAPPVTVDAPPPPPLAIDLAVHRRRRRLLGGGGLLAVAAALALWIRLGGEGPAPSSDPLAPYALVVRNEEVRSDRSVGSAGSAEAAARYRLDSRIHWVLSPDEAVTDPERLRVRVWATDGASTLTIDPTTGVSIAQSGAVEIRGILGEILPLEPGRWSLRFGIGPELATDPEAAARDPRARVVGPYAIALEE